MSLWRSCVGLGAAVLFLGSGFSVRAETAPDAPTAGVDLTVLLDPDAAPDARLQQLTTLKRLAKQGDHPATCLLGRLAFAGTRHAAKLPEFEFGDAAGWLNRCVLGGDLDALLVMAELEIRDRRGLEAMIWMQSYLKLAASLTPDTINNASAYKAGILARIEKLYETRRPSNEEVLEYVAGFLDSYGERISAGFKAGGWRTWPALPTTSEPEWRKSGPALVGKFARDTTHQRDELVYATYVIEVDAKGKPDRILVMEAYPDAKSAKTLNRLPMSQRFNESTAPGARWTYLSAYLDNEAYDLLPSAGAKYRPRED